VAVDVSTIVALLGTLGFGSVIGQWFGASKDRRTARAAVLKELGSVELARWYEKGPEDDGVRLHVAIRALETAALIARLPRPAIRNYAQLATACLSYVQGKVEDGEHLEVAGISMDFSDVVHDAGEIVSKAAWGSPFTRWTWLPRRLRRSEQYVAALDKGEQRAIERARRDVR
jgi:hypothetical protein